MRIAKQLKQAAMVALAIAGLGVAQAHAAFEVDVRVAGGGKNANIQYGDLVTVEVYLRDLPANSNGLGSYALSLKTRNETTNGVAWPADRTPSDTVLNFVSSSFTGVNAALQDILAPWATQDIGGLVDNNNDTDIDAYDGGGGQFSVGGWTPNLGVASEILLGSMTFQALSAIPARPGPWTVEINTYFTDVFGSNGGLVLQGLTSTSTSMNSVASGNLASAAIINANPVVITVGAVAIPEPASLGMLAVGALALLRRRSH